MKKTLERFPLASRLSIKDLFKLIFIPGDLRLEPFLENSIDPIVDFFELIKQGSQNHLMKIFWIKRVWLS